MRIITWIFILSLSIIAYLYLQTIQPKVQTIIQIETPTLDLEMEELNAISYLNELRKATGLLPFHESKQLRKSAKNHAAYLIENNQTSHYEQKSNPLYTGHSIAERTKYTGYKASYVSENLSGGQRNYKESIDGLFAAIYHRFGFLDFKVNDIGIAIKQGSNEKQRTSFVYNMGSNTLNQLCNKKSFTGYGHYIHGICVDKTFKIKKKRFDEAIAIDKRLNKKVVTYPYHHQKDIPPAFFEETPDPLPNHEVSGFPISISFDEEQYDSLKLTSFKLFDKKDHEVTNTLLYDHKNDIHHMFKPYEFALFPLKRLQWNHQYEVRVTYVANGIKKKKTWNFTTRTFNETIHTVTKNNYNFMLKRGVSAIFYFKPLTEHELLKDIRFPLSVSIKIIDANTIRLTANEDAPDHLKLNIDGHPLNLGIK